MKIKELISKKNLIQFLVIFFVSVVVCNGFIRMHYTTDTYKIADEGYINYAMNWSLKDGRIFMALFLYICNFFKLPINLVNFLFTLFGIFFSCIAVMLLKKIIVNLNEIKKSKSEVVILILSYFAIFNFMYIEAIYFLEIIIISLSLLFYLVAIDSFINMKNNSLVKPLIFSVLGVMAYQGTISFFIATAMFLLILRNNKINKAVLVDILGIILITVITVLTNIVLVKYICDILDLSQNRFNIGDIANNVLYIFNNFISILTVNCGIMHTGIYLIFLTILIIFEITYFKINELDFIKHLIRILFIIVFTIGAAFSIFLATTSSFDCGRMYVAIGALPSFLLVYLCCNSGILEIQNSFEKFLYLIIAIWTAVNIYTYFARIHESRVKNDLEKEYCEKIYEECIENNYNLDEACILQVRFDANEIYFDELKTKNKMTINEIRGLESAISGFNVNTKCELKEVSSDEVREKYFEKLENGDTGINETYVQYIDGILVMPVFIW